MIPNILSREVAFGRIFARPFSLSVLLLIFAGLLHGLGGKTDGVLVWRAWCVACVVWRAWCGVSGVREWCE
jgi:hypothetical protein